MGHPDEDYSLIDALELDRSVRAIMEALLEDEAPPSPEDLWS